ncbi:MAG: toll/interleukin-1 receptor domain-containing protein [Opitutaceae bacterium]|nr:toll/interleukin-1 receptor domain-containing protein [Opitutaceae bacterium]
MSKSSSVFISYRRDGGDGLAGRVRDALTKRGYKVFLDVEDLRSGKFNEALFGQIDRCTDFIVILSPNSLDRCVNEGDWVRLEIAHALNQKKNIVPVLGRNFHFPEKLPADIDDLRHYNGIGASHDLFEASMDKLASHLHSNPDKPSRLPKIAAILGAVAMVAVIGVAVFWKSSSSTKSDPAETQQSDTASRSIAPQSSQPTKTANSVGEKISPTLPSTDSALPSTPGNATLTARSTITATDSRPAPDKADVLSRLKLFNKRWVTTREFLTSMQLTYRQLAQTVKTIRLGEAEDKLDLVYSIPDESEGWLDMTARFPVRPGSSKILAQLEFKDGSWSQVQELAVEEFRNFIEAEGAVIRALSSAKETPPLMMGTIRSKLPGNDKPDILGLTLLAPRTVKKWKLAFDDVRYPDLEIGGGETNDRYQASSGKGEGWAGWVDLEINEFGTQMMEKPLQISWIDVSGAEHGPFLYDLSVAHRLLLGAMKNYLLKDPKGEMVWTVSLPKQTYQPNPKQNLMASGWGGQDPYPATKDELLSRLEYHGLGFINGEGIWGKSKYGGSRSHALRWLSVKEIRYGTQENRFDHVVKLDESAKNYFTQKDYELKGWKTSKPLSLGSNYVFVQLTFFDGTKSEVIWYKVSDLLTVAWWDKDP